MPLLPSKGTSVPRMSYVTVTVRRLLYQFSRQSSQSTFLPLVFQLQKWGAIIEIWAAWDFKYRLIARKRLRWKCKLRMQESEVQWTIVRFYRKVNRKDCSKEFQRTVRPCFIQDFGSANRIDVFSIEETVCSVGTTFPQLTVHPQCDLTHKWCACKRCKMSALPGKRQEKVHWHTTQWWIY